MIKKLAYIFLFVIGIFCIYKEAWHNETGWHLYDRGDAAFDSAQAYYDRCHCSRLCGKDDSADLYFNKAVFWGDSMYHSWGTTREKYYAKSDDEKDTTKPKYPQCPCDVKQ